MRKFLAVKVAIFNTLRKLHVHVKSTDFMINQLHNQLLSCALQGPEPHFIKLVITNKLHQMLKASEIVAFD